VLACGGPVLILPHDLPIHWVDHHVLIAWNGSREARRAVLDAMPLIAVAGVVTVVSVDADKYVQEMTADLIAYLERQGLHPVCEFVESGLLSVGDTLRARLRRHNADVLVMGAYGHFRLSEMILGGVSRNMLGDMVRPVLMSH
jgi:nucleotide-binding universal stress UspA family protein